MSDPLGHTVSFTFDPAGRMTQTDPRGNQTTHTYDPKGHLASQDAFGNTTTFTYDSRGLQTSVIDALGNPQTSEYDQYGRLIKQTNANGDSTLFTYDMMGRVLATGRSANLDGIPMNVITGQQYDAKGQTIAVIDELGNVSRNEYDANGNFLHNLLIRYDTDQCL